MTNKEAIKNIETISDLYLHPWIRKTCDFVIEALAKGEKYKWHDLRKDPTDLPSDNTYIVYLFKEEASGRICSNSVHIHSSHYARIRLTDTEKYTYIAWKEIEPFEEVEE